MNKTPNAASILLHFPQNVEEVILGEWAVIYSVRISETSTKW